MLQVISKRPAQVHRQQRQNVMQCAPYHPLEGRFQLGNRPAPFVTEVPAPLQATRNSVDVLASLSCKRSEGGGGGEGVSLAGFRPQPKRCPVSVHTRKSLAFAATDLFWSGSPR